MTNYSYTNINSFFGPRLHITSGGTEDFHRGIDIVIPQADL